MLTFNKDDKVALLIVDMQNDFVLEDGVLPAENSLETIENIKLLSNLCRKNNIPVVYTQHVHRDDLSDFGIAHYFEPPSCLESSDGKNIIDQIAPQDGDLIITNKRRYDAFIGTDLDMVLRGKGINSLIVVGVMTDACVMATVHHARGLDYKVCIVSDACAGTTNENHEAALRILGIFCALPATTNETIEIFKLK
jgi:nicotinamidase-related amidase